MGDVSDADLNMVPSAGRYRGAEDFTAVQDANFVSFCVPTPYHADAPDLDYV